MSQVARLYGSSPALIYVGLRLLDMGYEVRLSMGSKDPQSAPLRPQRLRSQAVSLLKEAFRRQARPYFFLEEAPTLASWAEVGKERLSSVFDRSYQLDRWVDGTQLTKELLELFQMQGGRRDAAPLLALPSGRSGVALEIMDIDPSEIPPEQLPSYFSHLDRRPSLRMSELWLPNVDDSLDEADFAFVRFEATLAISETHPIQGKVFSLYSSSEYSLQRALRALKDPRGVAPTGWKAQVLSEKAPRERASSVKWGYSGFYRPGVWCLGASVGKLNPALNLEASESLLQADRFVETLQKLPRGQSLLMAAEDWRRSEKAHFLSSYKRARFMEKAFFSETRGIDWVQRTSTLLPSKVRQLLKSPI